MPARSIREAIDTLNLVIVPFDAELAYLTGLLRTATRAAGLSLGDRACLALAQRLSAPVLTADQAWKGLDVGVEIRHIR